MRIIYNNTPGTIRFSALRPGQLYRNENNQGLFVKSNVGDAVVIEPIPGSSVGAGQRTSWDDQPVVYPVASITVQML